MTKSGMAEFQKDLNGLNEYPTFGELKGAVYDEKTHNLTFTLSFPSPCEKVTARLTPQYVENYPVGPLSLLIGDSFHVLPSAENRLSTVARNIQELCQVVLQSTPSTFGGGWDDHGMGTPSTSWAREATLELAPDIDGLVAGINPQLVSDISRVPSAYGIVMNDMPSIGKVVVILSISLQKMLSTTTCQAWGVERNQPLDIRLTLGRAEYTKASIKVEVGQAVHFRTNVFRGLVGQLQRILQTFCDSINTAETKEDTPLSALIHAGFEEKLARMALAKTNNNFKEAAMLLTRESFDTFNESGSPSAATTKSTVVEVKKYPRNTHGFFARLAEYAVQRTPSVSEYCVVCDRPHVFGGGMMIQAAVCSRELCVFKFNELLVGTEIADSVAVQTGVIDLLVNIAKAACGSNRWDVIFNPYPTVVDPKTGKIELNPDKKDIDKARRIFNAIPAMKQIAGSDSSDAVRTALTKAHPLAFNTFNWVVSSNRSHLVKIPKDDLIKCMGTPMQFIMATAPPELQERFERRKQSVGGKTKWAFHGSRAENWHSILRGGLRNATGTKFQVNGSAYGAGIYLSPHASVSFGYSNIYGSSGNTMDEYIDQGSMMCIAVIELVDIDTKKSGNIWVQPHEDCCMTRFFFVYQQGFSEGGGTNLEEKNTADQFYRAAEKFCQ